MYVYSTYFLAGNYRYLNTFVVILRKYTQTILKSVPMDYSKWNNIEVS